MSHNPIVAHLFAEKKCDFPFVTRTFCRCCYVFVSYFRGFPEKNFIFFPRVRKSIDRSELCRYLKERFREECSPRLLAVVVVIPSSVFVTAGVVAVVAVDFLFAVVDVGGGVWPLRHCSSYFTLLFAFFFR